MPIVPDISTDETGKIPVRDASGAVRGRVDPDTGEFITHRGTLRYNRPSIGFDAGVLERATALGATTLVVHCQGETYRSPIATMWRRGWVEDLSRGRQWFLALKWWNRPEPTPAPVQPPDLQLSLFFR